MQDLVSACSIVVQAFVGMRIGEFCGLLADHETNAGDDLPRCVTIEQSTSGLDEHFVIHGTSSKPRSYEDGAAEWLAGSRPYGTDYIPPPVVALQRLAQLVQVWDDQSRDELVIIPRLKGRKGAIESDDAVASKFSALQNRFIHRHIDVPEHLGDWVISTHQWRKSFGQYMIRTDERLLPAVADHFLHIGVATTERHYVGRSAAQMGLHKDASLETSVKVLSDMVYGDGKFAGKLADLVAKRKDIIRRRLENGEGAEATLTRLKSYLEDEQLLVWDADWGLCLFRAETSRCHHEAKGEFDLSAIAPAVLSRRADLCRDCSNFIVSPDHADFWRRQYDDNLASFRSCTEHGDRRLAAVALDRVRTARRVLRQLDVACPDVDLRS